MSATVRRTDLDAKSQAVSYSSDAGTRVLMKVRNLRKAFGGQVVLDGVSLDLHEGEIVLLRGDNGSGKTTLLNILTGNMEPDSGSIWVDGNGAEEHFEFPFRWWQELNPLSHFTPEKVAKKVLAAPGRIFVFLKPGVFWIILRWQNSPNQGKIHLTCWRTMLNTSV